jgi:hypothetical protein
MVLCWIFSGITSNCTIEHKTFISEMDFQYKVLNLHGQSTYLSRIINSMEDYLSIYNTHRELLPNVSSRSFAGFLSSYFIPEHKILAMSFAENGFFVG